MIWKEKKFYAKQDKSPHGLPRQYLNIRPEALIFRRFKGSESIFTKDIPKLSDLKMTLEEQNIMGPSKEKSAQWADFFVGVLRLLHNVLSLADLSISLLWKQYNVAKKKFF